MFNVVSAESILQTRRSQTIDKPVSYRLGGKMHTVNKKIVNGEMEVIDLIKPVGEMLTNAQTRRELMEKVVLDVELGREQVPTVYGPIYDRMENAAFPEVFDAKWAMTGSVVFLEHMEGEEVKFGSLRAEQGPTARIKGYTAGFEYTKEMEMFNQYFNFEILNRSFGEGHNSLLNHMHLWPIISFQYKATNKTAPVYIDKDGGVLANATGSHPALSLRATVKQALTDTRTKKRPGTILLANSADREDLLDALQSFVIGATPYKGVEGITTIIFYDGHQIKVGKKDYSYGGVPAGKAYLIRPRQGFKELVKQDLQINANDGDLSRLVEAQIVGDTWRGVFSAVEENVQEITFP